MGAPGDRNLVDFYFDTGLTYEGPFGREDDTIGSGFAYTRIGGAARSLDADTTATTPAYPVRSRETLLDVGYKFQVTAAAAQFPVHLQSRRRHSQPQRPGAADRRCRSARVKNDDHVLDDAF